MVFFNFINFQIHAKNWANISLEDCIVNYAIITATLSLQQISMVVNESGCCRCARGQNSGNRRSSDHLQRSCRQCPTFLQSNLNQTNKNKKKIL